MYVPKDESFDMRKKLNICSTNLDIFVKKTQAKTTNDYQNFMPPTAKTILNVIYLNFLNSENKITL